MARKTFGTLLSLVFFITLVVLCLIAQEAFSQSSSERTRLENNKKKLEQEIANTQKLLEQTKANKNPANHFWQHL